MGQQRMGMEDEKKMDRLLDHKEGWRATKGGHHGTTDTYFLKKKPNTRNRSGENVFFYQFSEWQAPRERVC